MKTIEEHAVLLNEEAKSLIQTKYFLFGNKLNPLQELVDTFYKDGYSFSEQANEFYEISYIKDFQNLMACFDGLQKLKEEGDYIVKNQKYQMAANFQDKEKHLYDKINAVVFENDDIHNLFYKTEDNKLLIKKFVNQEFNQFFLMALKITTEG